MLPTPNRHQKYIYLRLLSYMLLDWAQILKGSGFLWIVPSAGESWGGRPGRGWEGGGGAMLSLRGGARDGCTGESVWALLWLETLCWELFWLSFLDNCCRRSRSISFNNWKSAVSVHLWTQSWQRGQKLHNQQWGRQGEMRLWFRRGEDVGWSFDGWRVLVSNSKDKRLLFPREKQQSLRV